jgi:hypothetical protein
MCIRNVLISELLAVLLLGGAVAHAGSDIFSVNFYALGRTNQGANTEWNLDEWQKTLTLEADQAAGVDDWNTTGWENYVVPWNPQAPQDPATITSNQGSTATFTLITARNGAPYHWTQKRTTLLGDGNGDLMDGHANATEDDGELFDMTVSDIPFALYDVIIYLGANEGQFGDGTAKIVFNGGPEQDFTLPSGEFATFAEIVDGTTPGNYVVFKGVTGPSFTVQAWGNGFNHIAPTGFQFRQAAPEFAGDPDPANEATDVLRDVILSWSPGDFANTHNVYFGTVFDNVNDAVLADAVSPGQTATTYDPPGRLDFGQTYYWRIDEVNAPPDSTIFKGTVWSFTTEPVAYPIAGENITATASSSNHADQGPENTINGSGLDADDLHSDDDQDMWLSGWDGPQPTWVQYEFDKVYKLHEMWVWNHNTSLEQAVGFGIREAVIEYSTDATVWTTLGSTHEFTQAPGGVACAHNSVVDLNGVSAKYFRLTANSNWNLGGWINQYGLSEVRFFSLPVLAREPGPASGAQDVDVDSTLAWRSGREADRHDVYLSSDEQAVIDGTADAVTVTEPGYTPSLDLASTYYWRIDEANDVETPTIWQGDIWYFTTQEFIVVDDFESYNDIPVGEEGSNLVYSTWADGFDNPSTNGSTIGYTEMYQPSMETSIVHDGKQAVPLFYNNTVASHSEVTANIAGLEAGKDWSKYGIKGLTLRFYGDPNNSVNDRMYVKINGTKIAYDSDAANLTRAGWQMWYVDLASVGVNLSNVNQLAVGFERSGAFGGQGMVLLDGIRLYSYDRQLVTPVDPGTVGLQAHYEFEGNTNDSSGNARNGTLQGGATFAAGYVGQAISLNGTDAYVNIDGYKGILADANGVQHEFTLSAWIRTTDNGEIITWGTNAGGQRMTFRVDTVLRVEHASGNIRGTNGPDLRDDQWYHVAATIPQGARMMDVTLYVDGYDVTPGSTTTAAFNLTGTTDVSIGRRATHDDRYFIGSIDDARIYDRVLSQGEIFGLTGATMPFDKPF